MWLNFRTTTEEDFEQIWQIYKNVTKDGDSYLDNPNNITKEYAYKKWLNKTSINIVAEFKEEVVGFYSLRHNFIDYGSHVANGSYIISHKFRQKGFGKQLALHSIDIAKDAGYKAMQFNFVLSTNVAAIKLWQSVGFKIIGTSPQSYQHQKLNKLVDSHIMHRFL
ncbi:GNAT family N-acetyltransferase [Flavobacteriaceae bacterium]|nr:GNAT family N-acetyltransferase [Flavobacteriaceae bacterium]